MTLTPEKEKSAKTQAGLTTDEAAASRRLHGSNVISRGRRKSFFRRYLECFGDPIIKILLGAVVINLVISAGNINIYETLGIVAAVFLSTIVSAVSEAGSERAFDRLNEISGDMSSAVMRDGELTALPISEIVVGDIVAIGAGDMIPADGVIISGSVSVDQSALNGETREEEKLPSKSVNDAETLTFDKKNALLRGSVAVFGSCRMRVMKVGSDTLYGKIAASLDTETRDSPMRTRLSVLAKNVSAIGYAAAALVAAAYLFNAFFISNGMSLDAALQDIGDLRYALSELISALTLAVSILVVAVPEGLPMMITVVLSANTRRMLRDNVLIKKHIGIETAGSMNILFTDKTGTLTRGELNVTSIITKDAVFSSPVRMRSCRGIYDYFLCSCVCNTESAVGWQNGRKTPIGGNATDRALLGCVMSDAAAYSVPREVGRVGFDSRRKYSSVTLDFGGRRETLVKGAPELILQNCRGYIDSDGTRRPMLSCAGLISAYRKSAGGGARVVALAVADGEAWEHELYFIALAVISDETRAEARASVSELTSAGVQVVMITGDGEETAAAVASRVGILKRGRDRIVTGAELSSMTDDEVTTIIPSLAVVARALPSDKERLVLLSQNMGLVVGMTGDGVNDAPALKAADVGFALGGGTEVAREAGDIVILDDNIKSIGRAVLYGRTIFDSIRKFIVFQLTMNLSAVGVSIIGPFLGIEAPVTVIQMLWVNMIMDTLGGLAFAGEAPNERFMRDPPKSRGENILSVGMVRHIIVSGIFTAALSLLFLMHPFFRESFDADTDYLRFMTVFFAFFVFAGIFTAFCCRTDRVNIFSGLSKNRAFIFIMSATCVVQLLIVYFGGDVFRTTPISARDLSFALTLAFSVVPFDMLRKALFG
ncbi:MAG: calcium-translocating P-type ATPase, PMCA-type [Firmicutes bacterium]|nr:calcium-translocating P-type ATPase, PMCA-type [Bacillota bacterium]